MIYASDSVTLSYIRDIASSTWYYKLQLSSAAAPAKPTTDIPIGWSTEEPDYTDGDYILYTTQKTTFSDETFEYTDVSISSSYDAAKAAARTAINYMASDETGVMVADLHDGQQTPSTATGRNVLIDNDSVDIRNGQTAVASFAEESHIGALSGRHVNIGNGGLQVYSGTQDQIANIGYGTVVGESGQSISSEFYTLGRRKAGTTIGEGSMAEGLNTTASGWLSHAEGEETVASHHMTHAEGWQTTASGQNAHAEGQQTVASSQAAHAEGESTQATNSGSHAEGYKTKATGAFSHAEGDSCTASKEGCHAEGYKTIASGAYSHSSGVETVANGYAQTAIGHYNKADPNATFLIGDGSDSSHRSNSFAFYDGGVMYSALTSTEDLYKAIVACGWKNEVIV
ncbi:MAG: hypothetical protein E7238_00145 [Sarcina sp.]|nr:hypothetical protein [Sarcina sp.]